MASSSVKAAAESGQPGFGNHFSSEALPGALPSGQNTPQRAPYGLYAEQLSGTAFTAPRESNLRTWLYRLRPSVVQGEFVALDRKALRSRPFQEAPANPTPLRWNALPPQKESADFIDGLVTMMGAGVEGGTRGSAVHVYRANRSMEKRFFYNADGELLIVPQQGALKIRTELGTLDVAPLEIALIPRGIKFQVQLREATAYGYVCENYGAPFRLPQLGPIGANGLANPRDFLAPLAAYEDREGDFELVANFGGELWKAPLTHSPLDVVGWHGNYVPYKYDLRKFQVISPVNYDHPDPSIFTVLTSPSELPGVANIDFVAFAPRWLVTEHTFRPPYFHRNVMSECMGLIQGVYDAKQTGFVPGGMSLHNSFSGHGPDTDTFEKASQAGLQPEFLADTMAFMFESSLPYRPTAFALKTEALQKDYVGCWRGLKKHFTAASR